MNAPSIDIKDILSGDSSVALVFATDLFVGKEPPRPDNVVTIFDTPGYRPSLSMDGETYEYPSVQIRVRNNSYLNAWTLINNILTSLHGRAHFECNDALYEVIYCDNGPALLDWDDNGRVRFIINFNLQRKSLGV